MSFLVRENLSHDPVHGYIAFSAGPEGTVSERDLIDDPWIQRLRHIHQLQTAWWVFPTAEHTRFPHILGAMHLASRFIEKVYDSLRDVCPDCPSRGYVESLLRLAGLLHDVGHGPFGHFFDAHFLSRFGLTHESLGALIIRTRLADKIRAIRANPNSMLEPGETLDPDQIAWLIQRPSESASPESAPERAPESALPDESRPRWLWMLRSLLSGIYTIDNMDFVLRDAYMSGYSQRAFDLDRLLHYTFFSEQGLTIHDRGMEALVRFIGIRAELFRTIYFHRTVRAIDLMLTDLFAASGGFIFDGNPAENLDGYLRFTEDSLLVDVGRWSGQTDPKRRELGRRWEDFLDRRLRWKMVCQRNRVYGEGDAERSSIFTDPAYVEAKIRANLPAVLADLPLRVDIARHIHRPQTRGPSRGQNFLYDSARKRIRPLSAHQLYEQLPVSHRICRVYAENGEHAAEIARALDNLLGVVEDDVTNM